MTDAQVERCRKRLEQFLVDLLEPVGRSERRHWGSVYVRGLLLNGDRKSIEPMAARLPEGNVQAMQQFIGQSPWEWNSVWERLARRMTKELEPEPAWIIDDTGFPKQGQPFGRRGAPVFGDVGQGRQLPGRREPASCRPDGEHRAGLAVVLARELGQRSHAPRRGGHSRRHWFPVEVAVGPRPH